MNYYLEINVLPDPEFKQEVLMNAVFAKFHRTLVILNSTDIGVSFPNFTKKTLASRLRLHGSESALNHLMKEDWFKNLRDYVTQTAVKPIPENTKYRVVKRLQAKSSIERLRRRSIKKGWLTEVEAIEKIPKVERSLLNLPFLQLRSFSTKQSFRLFIDHSEIQDSPQSGQFNSYGLSQVATIPWF